MHMHILPAFSPDPTGTPSPSPRDLQCCLKVRQVRPAPGTASVYKMRLRADPHRSQITDSLVRGIWRIQLQAASIEEQQS